MLLPIPTPFLPLYLIPALITFSSLLMQSSSLRFLPHFSSLTVSSPSLLSPLLSPPLSLPLPTELALGKR